MTMWLQRVLLLALLAAAGCGGGATTTGGGGGGEDTAEGDALADRGGGGEDSEDDTLGQCLTDQDCAALFPDLGPCQVAECDLKTLSCSVKDAADGTVCDDDDECTGNDMCTGGECGGEVVPCCGDGECNGDETCEDCQTDCGACPPECGDGFCNGEETCEDCPGDCGPCPSTCGNDECDGDEDCHTCPDDCGDCPAECGDGACNGEETCEDCVEDCGECPPECGDDVCDPEGESCALCAADCGECTGDCCAPQEAPGCEVPAVMMCVCEKDGFCCSVAWDEQCVGEVTEYLCGTCDAGTCGDGICGGDETCESCPGDCGACTTCGNNVCEPEESCVVCAKDCGLCEGDCCAPHEGPGCDDPAVSECVCSHEIGCCKDDWDADCVAQVTTFACGDCGPVVECGDGLCQGWETCELCPEDCGTCGAGSCCTPKETPKCEDAAITACVCAEDPYCCDTKWDWICVNEVDTLGCGTCQVCGDGACTGTEDSLSCCEDCGNCLAEGCPAVCECDEFCCGNWDDWCDVECSGTSCGDGVCQPCEDETTCAGDCAAPDPVCGDGICTADAGEDSHSCCEDCGNCAAHGCGDICECDPFCCSDWDEWCDLECAGTSCGDDICQPCETEDSCAEDCAAPDPFCGDGICTADAGEDATTCCEDCGNCSMRGCADVCVCDPFCCASWDEWCEVECNGTSCGDGVCQPCETEDSCAVDCAAPVPVCGDGICTPEAGENGESCCEDCGLCASHGCADVCECDPYCCTDWDWICDAEC
ncbi:MAG: hypothetical protein FJ098_07515, partial [Deltaproteobacteria bacterium]|nr:hypothetical protein [Deltaproteobacteria bacterium]